MHNELTEKDIALMKQELDHRRIHLRPQLLEAVKEARAFGDLSENFEYKAAKQEKNRNESRIRHLKNMIKTAIIIEDNSKDDEIGLSDTVTLYIEEDDVEETYTIVTNIRVSVEGNYISYESPVAKAILGRHEGDRVLVKVSEDYSYYCVIRKIEKGTEDDSRPIRGY